MIEGWRAGWAPSGAADRWLGRPGRAATVICSSVEKVVMVRARGRLRNLVSALRGAERLVRAFLFVSPVTGQLHSQGMRSVLLSSFPFIRGGLAHSLRVLRKTLQFVKAVGGEATRGITYLFITYKWAYPYGSQQAAGVTLKECRSG